jgi:hypothetical protein
MTELLKSCINPALLELIKQPIDRINISGYFSFDIQRNGRWFSITIYDGENGQINISDKEHIMKTYISDYCKTPEDFQKLIERFDEMITRFPPIKTS